MGVGAGLYMCDVVKKFTFAILSPGEFLLTLLSFLTNKRVHNVYTKNLLAVGAPRQIPLGGGFTTLLQTPQVGPPMARECGARTLRLAPSALVPDCGAQIMVTLFIM